MACANSRRLRCGRVYCIYHDWFIYLPIALASEVEFKPAGGPNISLKEDLTGREMFVDWKDVQGNHVTVNMIVNKGGYVNGSTADSTARDYDCAYDCAARRGASRDKIPIRQNNQTGSQASR